MNFDTKKMWPAMALALALTFTPALSACGGSSSDSSDTSSESTEAESTETEATEEEATDETATDEETTSSDSTSAESTSSSSSVDVSSMTGFMGVSDKGETFYYAESADGTAGVMVVLDPSTGQYVSFVGAVTNPQPGYVTITDESTGNTLTFEVSAAEQQEDGSLAVVVDLGEQGTAVLAQCDINEVIQAIAQIDQNGTPVA